MFRPWSRSVSLPDGRNRTSADPPVGVYDLPRLVQSDAFRTVLLAFKDGPHELGASLTGFLLYCTNKPATRHLLVPGADLEVACRAAQAWTMADWLQMVLVGLTEEFGKPSARHHARFLEKLQHSVMNVSMLLSSWPGEPLHPLTACSTR